MTTSSTAVVEADTHQKQAECLEAAPPQTRSTVELNSEEKKTAAHLKKLISSVLRIPANGLIRLIFKGSAHTNYKNRLCLAWRHFDMQTVLV